MNATNNIYGFKRLAIIDPGVYIKMTAAYCSYGGSHQKESQQD